MSRVHFLRHGFTAAFIQLPCNAKSHIICVFVCVYLYRFQLGPWFLVCSSVSVRLFLSIFMILCNNRKTEKKKKMEKKHTHNKVLMVIEATNSRRCCCMPFSNGLIRILPLHPCRNDIILCNLPRFNAEFP